ncbi:MAG: YihY/virulence factor BrkB family protein [Bacteroidetes bacterium]|nr:YihY/virulence factor BrkB family protein [Bacteroidota bacterium]MBL0064702.1 YihY/virulence factor BrkB family protein [Bacteroidota bacterium]MBL0137339.1 YihY/virulence factor BrkB family protein [Bacteroidota bacterium]
MKLKLKTRLKNVKTLFSDTMLAFIDDNALKLSAALSYYTIFSLPPLLIVIISISGVFFGADAVKGELYGQINGLVGNTAAFQIQEMIKNITLSTSSTFATIIGIIILLVGASGVFAEIQDSLNFIWGIQAKPKRGLFKFIKNRLVSFSMIGTVGFLLMVGLIVNSLMDVLNHQLSAFFPRDSIYFFYIMNLIVVFLIIALLFTVIFKTLPDGKIALKDCLIGASFTSLLFMIGKFAIGAYLSTSEIATVYGAAGSVILILIWVYYSAIILYFGAEFTKVYAINHGEKIIPKEYAVIVAKQKIEIPSQSE